MTTNSFPPNDHAPEDSTEATSRSSFEGEEEDSFDTATTTGKGNLPMPPSRIDNNSSISSPFVLEFAPRNGRLGSKDPLFQGVCLYDGAMTEAQVEKYNGQHGTRSTVAAAKTTTAAGAILATSSCSSSSMGHRSSWTSSVLRLFSASSGSRSGDL